MERGNCASGIKAARSCLAAFIIWGQRMKIAIAHDYLLQHGGAERVVATWASRLPSSVIHALAYRESHTFEIFRERIVRGRINADFAKANIEYLLPTLPILARQVRVEEADVALVSTSGWAHQFDFQMPSLAYVHSPARWLYARDDYSKKLGTLGKVGLGLSKRFLTPMDAAGMRRMTTWVSNSRVTQNRMFAAYGLDTTVVHPPVDPLEGEPAPPTRPIPSEFSLVVSRNRGYKNVALALAASSLAGLASVVVGAGTEEYDRPDSRVYGLGRVTDTELKWLYANAQVLIGSASEDFGLTVVEANLEGTPVAAIPAGGYLETVHTDVSGALADSQSAEDLAAAIRRAMSVSPTSCQAWGETFSTNKHMEQLMSILRTL